MQSKNSELCCVSCCVPAPDNKLDPIFATYIRTYPRSSLVYKCKILLLLCIAFFRKNQRPLHQFFFRCLAQLSGSFLLPLLDVRPSFPKDPVAISCPWRMLGISEEHVPRPLPRASSFFVWRDTIARVGGGIEWGFQVF